MDTEVKRLLIQLRPLTFRTNRSFSELFRPFLSSGRSVFLLQHLDILHNSFIRYKIVGRSTYQWAFYFDTFIRTIQNFINSIIGQVFYRSLQWRIVLLQQSTDLPENHRILIFTQRSYCPFIDRHLFIGNHFIHINLANYSQSFTTRTSTLRSRLPVRQSRNRTHQAFAIVSDTLCLRIENHQQSVSLTHGGGNTLFQPFIILIFYDQFVNDYFNIMILITIQFQTMCNLTNLPVDTDIQVSFFPDLFKEFFIMSLTRTHQRGQHIDFLPFIIFQNKFQYLFFGVFHHLFSRKIRISYSGTGIKQT